MTFNKATLLSLAFVALPALANDWDYPEDIPVIEPVTVGLAGEKPADIIRYLLAEGAGPAEPSPDGPAIVAKVNDLINQAFNALAIAHVKLNWDYLPAG